MFRTQAYTAHVVEPTSAQAECSFCGKRRDRVEQMIGSTMELSFICNECVDDCNRVLDPDAGQRWW